MAQEGSNPARISSEMFVGRVALLAGHPVKDLFDPAGQPPAKSFGHVLGDGFGIVHHHADLPADQVAQLRTYVTDPAAGRP